MWEEEEREIVLEALEEGATVSFGGRLWSIRQLWNGELFHLMATRRWIEVEVVGRGGVEVRPAIWGEIRLQCKICCTCDDSSSRCYSRRAQYIYLNIIINTVIYENSEEHSLHKRGTLVQFSLLLHPKLRTVQGGVRWWPECSYIWRGWVAVSVWVK